MDYSYVAGFLDADGSISINLCRYKRKDGTIAYSTQPNLQFSQKERWILDEIKDFLQAGHITDHHTAFALHIQDNEKLLRIIPLIDGKVLVKRGELEILKEFTKIRGNRMSKVPIEKSTWLKIIELCERLSHLHKHANASNNLIDVKEWVKGLSDNEKRLKYDKISKKLKGRSAPVGVSGEAVMAENHAESMALSQVHQPRT